MTTDKDTRIVLEIAQIYEFLGKKFPSDEIIAHLERGKYYIINKQKQEVFGPYKSTKEAFSHVTVSMHFKHYKVCKWKGKSFSKPKQHYGRLQQGSDGQPFHINPSLAHLATRRGLFD